MAVLLNIIFLISLSFQASEAWKLEKDMNGIQVFTRRLKGQSFDQVKIKTKVNTTLMQATAALEDINAQVDWVYATEKVKFLESPKSGHIIYHYFMNMPFPIEDRDVIIEYTREQNQDSKIVTTTSKNIRDNELLTDDYERINQFETKYILKPIGKGQIEINYFLSADPGTNLPSWLVNMFTTKGFIGIPGILQYDTFYGFFKVEGKDKLVAGGRYRPLTLVMFAIEYALFGESPFIGHLGNVLLYGLLGMVLYLLLIKLFRARGDLPSGVFIALLTTLFFMAHPIHTEVVANIKGRDEIMTLLGSLAALLFSIKAYQTKKNWLNIIAGLIFFLGLMAKENAITFLAVIPLTYFIFTKAKFSKIAIQTLPFLLGAILFLVIRGQVLGGNFGGAVSMELMNNPFLKIENGRWVALAFGEKMATITFMN